MQTKVTEIFATVKDPRSTGMCKHKLVDILFIGFCTLISNGEDFEDMVVFAKENEKWLRKYLELPNGIPSHDTFNRALQMVDCQQLSEILGKDGQFLLDCVRGSTIQIDGKKIKGVSPKSKGNDGMYILSAWVGENKLCIGQKVVEEKSNEITAIPKLLSEIDIRNSLVSIDAIGTQTEIADTIVEGGGDYLLSVKGNQKGLYEEVSDDFVWLHANSYDKTWEYDHGRYETRKCFVVEAESALSPEAKARWKNVSSLIKIEATRTKDGVINSESRYYISSKKSDAEFFNNAVRGHWRIENHLHWHLDVTFNEDKNRSRTGNAPENLNIFRKMALHRIGRLDDKLSMKKRRYKASMSLDYLEKIIE